MTRIGAWSGACGLMLVGLLLVLPLGMVLSYASGANTAWLPDAELVANVLTTLRLLFWVSVTTLLLGVGSAWWVSFYQFPARGILSWALVLPLAIPAYIMAYIYAELADSSGPIFSNAFIKSTLYQPEIFSLGGMAWVMSISLYPYVYLAARVGFAFRSAASLSAARSLGASEGAIFWRITLPVARPAIAAGLALALMETLADYGAADFLQVNTLTLAIFRAWHSYGDVTSAIQISLWLLIIAATLVYVERMSSRGKLPSDRQGGTHARQDLNPTTGRAVSFGLFCIVGFGFIAPISLLVRESLSPRSFDLPLWEAARATLILGGLGASITIMMGLIIGLGQNFPKMRAGLRLINLFNYAQAGPILALGATSGIILIFGGLYGWLSLPTLIWVYVCRFANSGTEQISAGAARISPSLHIASHSLGREGLAKIWHVDLPLLAPAILTGALIVGIEVIKELPATLILRPFGWDTLAILSHFYAKDEALSVAALPALIICCASILPIWILTRRLK